MMPTVALEIAVTSVAGARAAAGGGADRVELCCGLELGGLTPSAGLVDAVAQVGVPVSALVRCRPGDFVYSVDEIATMEQEVRSIARAGVAGVVVGVLDRAGGIDADQLGRLVAAARNVDPAIDVTLHRAVDQCDDPCDALPVLEALRVDRVLTSGGASAVSGGLNVIRRMARLAPALDIMAGGGLSPAGIPDAVGAGATSVHLSAKRTAQGAAPARVALGAQDQGSGYFVTDEATVHAAREALDGVGAG